MFPEKDLPSPFDYTDFRVFLKDLYLLRKNKKTRYSFRKFASELGFKASNYLHLVISGKRLLSPEAIQKIVSLLRVKAAEKKYLTNLIFLNQCRNPKQKEKLIQERNALLEKHRSLVHPEQYAYFSRWYLPILRELVSLNSFQANPKWMAKKLKLALEENDLREGFQILQKLKMIALKDGAWKQIDKHLTASPQVSYELILKYHREMIKISEAGLGLSHEDRNISALTMSLSERQFEWVKERVEAFRDEIQQAIQESQDTPTLIAQLNIQALRLTK